MVDWDAMVLQPLHGQFAEPVVYQPAAGPAVPGLTGVFDDAYQSKVQLEDGSVGWNTASPTLGIRLQEWGAPPQQGEQITIVRTGQLFVVVDARPDGHGEIRLIMGAAS